MTDSPRVSAPLNPAEQPILENLLNIRNQLELMKQDKSCFVKCNNVLKLYSDTVEQVHTLNKVRAQKQEEHNRVDTVLDDCLQLISMAFMTVGRNTEIPAMYSVVSVMKRLIDHLKEAMHFSNKDLEMFIAKLDEYSEVMAKGKAEHDPQLVTLLETRIAMCRTGIKDLQDTLEGMNPRCMPTYEQLVSILRCLSSCNVRSSYPKEEVEELREQLKVIRERVGHGEVTGTEESLVQQFHDRMKIQPANGQELLEEMLTRCSLWAELIEARHGRIAESFRPLFDKLLAIRNNLESRYLLQAWSMRETDLYEFGRQLDRVDESRAVNGNFIDANGNAADLQTQRTLLYLLRKSYALIYLLLTASKPVSEALLPIYNQLTTLNKCLREVQKAGGISSPRELYPYKMKLNSIDKMRVDGKFMVNGIVPEGQAAIMKLMNDCYEFMDELQNAAESSEDEQETVVQPQAISAV